MRALALFSGGLDSMLSIKIITMQNIEVVALNINIGFGSIKDMSEIFKNRANKAGASFQVVDVRQRYIDEVLFSSKYGYGKNFNPCIDCHGFMLNVAKELLGELKADFIISGEVLGQRPMSQNRASLNNVLKLSNDEEDVILRPLSAKLLKPTTPEIKGWVDREKLFDIQGRDRKRQFELAKKFGFDEYQTPGGGCLLTEEFFSKKLREFIEHKPLRVNDIDLLKIGRHFRLPNGAKLVLGRDERENDILEKMENSEYLSLCLDENLMGPSGKISKEANREDKLLACQITLAFAKASKESTHVVKVGDEDLQVTPSLDKNEAKRYSLNEK